MNPQEPSNIFLSSSSSVSLHDRFTGLLKNPQRGLTSITARVQQQNSASLRNQRLALEMANRPSVLAALHNTSKTNNRMCKANLKSRLGQPMVKGRAGGWQGLIRPGGCSGQIKAFYGRRGISRPHWALGAQSGRGLKQPGGCVNWAVPMGVRGGGAIRKTGINPATIRTGSHFTSNSGAFLRKGLTKFNSSSVPSREELDKQLDEYMSNTKSHLDAELDAYMAEVDLKDIM